MPTHRIILADDHPAFLEGVSLKLERESGLKVVGQAHDGREALEMILAESPDLALLDMDMPFMTGLEVIRELRKSDSSARVLPLSGHADPEYVMGALEAGAAGYLMKNESLSTIVRAIRDVLSGGVYISGHVSKQIATRRLLSRKEANQEHATINKLIDAEITPLLFVILQLVGQGLNNKQIAKRLYKSEHTVRNQIQSIKDMIGVRWRPAIVAWTWRMGLSEIAPEDYQAAFERYEFILAHRDAEG